MKWLSDRYGDDWQRLFEYSVEHGAMLRTIVCGYMNEAMFKLLVLDKIPGMVTEKLEDRSRTHGDFRIRVGDRWLVIEHKTGGASGTKEFRGNRWFGVVPIANGTRKDIAGKKTGQTKRGSWDILAVSCIDLIGEWKWIYAAERELPQSQNSNLSAEQNKMLLPWNIAISYPPTPPFSDSLEEVIRRVVDEDWHITYEQLELWGIV
jgi:hypothetical protein